LQSASWNPGDGSPVVTLDPVFTHPAGASSSVVDVISPGLQIYRGGSRGLRNAGGDSVAWARGTCAAPTSGFYSNDFDTFMQNQFPYDRSTSILNQTICLRDDTTTQNYDLTIRSWGRADGGSFSYTRAGVTVGNYFNLELTHTYTGSDGQN